MAHHFWDVKGKPNDPPIAGTPVAAPTALLPPAIEYAPYSPPTSTAVNMDHAAASSNWRSLQTVNPHVCVEDTTLSGQKPSTDEYLWSFTTSKKVYDVKESWATAFKQNREITLPFPESSINYGTRIRTTNLTFTVQHGLANAKITQSRPSLITTMSAKQAADALFECKRTDCHHILVPLRIRLVGYQVKHTPSVKLSFQLRTDELSLSGDPEHAVVRDWIPNRVFESSTYSHEKMGDVTTFSDYGTTLVSNSTVSYHADPVVLYEADPRVVNRDYFDWMSEYWVSGFLSGLRRGVGDVLYLEQPDRVTNRSPNRLSYFITHDFKRTQNGTSLTKLDQFTHLAADGRPYYILNHRICETAKARLAERFSTNRSVMEITRGGLSGVFKPVNTDLWNQGLDKMKEKDPEQVVSMGVDLRMDYVVLGRAKAFDAAPTA